MMLLKDTVVLLKNYEKTNFKIYHIFASQLVCTLYSGRLRICYLFFKYCLVYDTRKRFEMYVYISIAAYWLRKSIRLYCLDSMVGFRFCKTLLYNCLKCVLPRPSSIVQSSHHLATIFDRRHKWLHNFLYNKIAK
jgi:hypothetical protein